MTVAGKCPVSASDEKKPVVFLKRSDLVQRSHHLGSAVPEVTCPFGQHHNSVSANVALVLT